MEENYPCDINGFCPFGESNSMYFCRDNCGLGVDENSNMEEENSEDEFYKDLLLEQQEQI